MAIVNCPGPEFVERGGHQYRRIGSALLSLMQGATDCAETLGHELGVWGVHPKHQRASATCIHCHKHASVDVHPLVNINRGYEYAIGPALRIECPARQDTTERD